MAENISRADKTDVQHVAKGKAHCANGHPQVWLAFEDTDKNGGKEVVCPYCSRVFVQVKK